MNFFPDAVLPWLRDLAAQSAKASLLACVVALICFLPRRWLSSGWRHVLWCAVFARLVLPDLPIPGWSWNVNRLLPEGITSAEVAPSVVTSDNAEIRTSDLPALASPPLVVSTLREQEPEIDLRQIPESHQREPKSEKAHFSPSFAPEVTAIIPKMESPLSWWKILATVWLAGAGLWWIALAAAGWRFRSRVVARRTKAGPQAEALLAECLRVTGVRTQVRLGYSKHIATPAVCGLLRPVILIPQSLESSLSFHELRLLLLHELGHVKRRDTFVQVFVSLVLGLHWWNPILWVACGRLRLEAEAATDAWVLKRTGPEAAPSYGAMLLALATRACGAGMSLLLVPSLIGASSQGKCLRQRLTSIVGHRPARRWAGVIGMTALLLLAMVSFSQETKSPAPADLYLKAFQMGRAAEKLESEGKKDAAVEKYLEAQILTQAVAKDHPEWDPEIVTFRLKNVEQALKRLGHEAPDSSTPSATLPSQAPASSTMPEAKAAKPFVAVVDVSRFTDVIGGGVVDGDGIPIEGANIEVQVLPTHDIFATSILPANYRRPAPVKSDSEGTWRFSGVPVGVLPDTPRNNAKGNDTYRFYITHPEYLFQEYSHTESFFMGDAEFRLQSAKLVLKRGHVIHGMVRDGDGLGVPGAKVQRNYDTFSRDDPEAVTDASGHYVIKAARAGNLTMRVTAEGYAVLQQKVGVDKDTTLDFTLRPANTITLRLVDQNHKPVTRGFVNFMTDINGTRRGDRLALERPDSEGVIRWRQAPSSEVYALCNMDRYEIQKEKVKAGEEKEIMLRPLPPQPVITVKVMDAATDKPLPGCSVATGTLLPNSGRPYWPVWQPKVTGDPIRPGSAEGTFAARLDDNYQRYFPMFRVKRDGYVPVITEPVDPQKGNATVVVRLQQQPSTPITVLKGDGSPADKAAVYGVWRGSSMELLDFAIERSRYGNRYVEFALTTKEDGQCVIPTCADDAVVFVVHEDGFASARYENLRKDGAMKLQPYGRVEANVVDSGGKPAAGMKFQYQGSMALPGERSVMFTANCESDAQGRLVLPRVLPSRQARLSESLPPLREGDDQRLIVPQVYKSVTGGQTTTFDLEAKGDVARLVKGRFVLRGGGLFAVPARGGNRVLLLQSGNSVASSAEFYRGGSFQFGAVMPGQYRLSIPDATSGPYRYTLGGGSLAISVPLSAPGKASTPVDLGDIEVIDRDNVIAVEAPLGKALYRIFVKDLEGKPVEGAEVRLTTARLESNPLKWITLLASDFGDATEFPSAKTNAQGMVELHTAAESRYGGGKLGAVQALVRREGYLTKSNVEVLANRETTIPLQGQAHVSVRLTLDGKPVPNPTAVTLAISGEPDSIVPVVSGAQRDVLTRSVKSGKKLMQAAYRAEDGTRLFSPAIITEGKVGDAPEFTLALKPGLRLAGRVSDEVPRPVEDARLAVFVTPGDDELAGPAWIGWTAVREDGTFEFLSLPPGHVRLHLVSGEWMSPIEMGERNLNRPWSAGFISASRNDLVIPVQRTATCEVTVVDAKGNPIPNATVRVLDLLTWVAFNYILPGQEALTGTASLLPKLTPDMESRMGRDPKLKETMQDLRVRMERSRLVMDRLRILTGSLSGNERILTDDQGHATLRSLAPNSSGSISVYLPGTYGAAKSMPTGPLKAGETTQLTIRVEPK